MLQIDSASTMWGNRASRVRKRAQIWHPTIPDPDVDMGPANAIKRMVGVAGEDGAGCSLC
jgi:hypothetical protein